VRATLTGYTLNELKDLANHVCAVRTIAEVKQLCNDFINKEQ